jgi:hypothetical protein
MNITNSEKWVTVTRGKRDNRSENQEAGRDMKQEVLAWVRVIVMG